MAPQTELSPQVERDLVEYRSLSPWAVAAVLFGVLSAAAVIGPLLWLIPAMAVIVSLIALWKISASQGQRLGRGAALLGLMLAIFFGLAGPARTLSRQYWLETRAQHVAAGFIDLLQHQRSYDAYQLTKGAILRKPPPADGTDPFAKDPDTKKDFDKFVEQEPIKSLLDPHQKISVESLSAKLVGSDDRLDDMEVDYRLRLAADGKEHSIQGRMYLERSLAYPNGNEQWRIISPAMRNDE